MINDLLSGSAQEGEQLKEIKIQMDVILITNDYNNTYNVNKNIISLTNIPYAVWFRRIM